MLRHHLFHFVLSVFLSFSLQTPFFAQSTDKLLKEANTLFKNENFIEATPKYLQLLSLEPRNSFYNYRYGACLLFNSEKKPDALKYLKFAVTDSNVDPEAHYYLARAYHLNYYFDRAIRSYLTYKGLVKDKTALKRDVDRQIEMCRNGQKLMSRISDIVVKERKTSTFADFFRAYNLKDIGGSIIVTAAFQTKVDRKRGHEPIIHILEGRDIIFYSSYGEVDEDHKDIYFRLKNAKGDWGEPVKLPNDINTPFDEDFPYLDPNGNYLYFSSKGHSSMGGYDVFRIPVNLEEMKFGKVENLDFAISSPDDDVFYVVDKDYKHAYFASSRQSEGGRIHVYRVLVNKFESNTLLIAGDFISSVNPQSKNATIQIRDLSTGKIINQIKTNPSTGALSFSLPRGGKYELIIQTENTKTPQVITYDAPFFDDSRLVKVNVLEEVSGAGVSLSINQDDYYQFEEEEKADVLAELFLNKAELNPNAELLELLESPTQTEAPSSTNEALKKLDLDKFNQEQLAQIATQDLNRLKENFRRNEDQRKVFLQLASDNIDQAQKAEESMNSLFDKAESGTLTSRDLQELQRLDKARMQYLAQAVAANQVTQNLKQNSAYIQGDIAKADRVRQILNAAVQEDDFQNLDDLSDAENTYVRENFNRISEKDPANLVGVNNISARLSQIEMSFEESVLVKQQLLDNQKELEAINESLEHAKKRDVPALQKRKEEVESTIEALQRQERVLSRKTTNLSSERDSLLIVQSIFKESQNINPNLVNAANNSRLIEAKLKTELNKKISAQAVDLINSAQILDETDELAADSNPASSESTTTESKLLEQLKTQLQDLDEQISVLNQELEKLEDDDVSKRLTLQRDKGRLLQEKSTTITQIVGLGKDEFELDIQELDVQLAINENVIAELEERNTIVDSQTSSAEDQLQVFKTQIEQKELVLEQNRQQLLNVPAGDYQQLHDIEVSYQLALVDQKQVVEKWLALEPNDDQAKNTLSELETKLVNSTKRLEDLKKVLATEAELLVDESSETPMNQTQNEAAKEELVQELTSLISSLKQVKTSRSNLSQRIQSVAPSNSSERILLEKELQVVLKEEIEISNRILALEPENIDVQSSATEAKNALTRSETELTKLETQLALSTSLEIESSQDEIPQESSRGDRALTALKESYNLEGSIREIDKNSEENLIRLQRYETALENMLEDEQWDEPTKSKIRSELKLVGNWLDDVSEVDSSEVASTNAQSVSDSPNSVQTEANSGDRALAALKESYNLEGSIREIDKSSEENLIRLQRYETTLENMLEDEQWDAPTKSKIRSELKLVSDWLDEVSEVDESQLALGNPEMSAPGNATNTENSATSQNIRLVSPNNEQAVFFADQIDEKKIENERLIVELESAESRSQERRLIKQIEKNEEQIVRAQYELLISESTDYEQVMEDMLASLDDEMKRNPLIKSEFFILSQKLDEVQEVVDILQVTKRANRERILVQAMNMREDFITQQNQLSTRINEKREVDRVVREHDIDPTLLADPRKLEYALANINDELVATQEKITTLERNLSSYAKVEQPRIQSDIEDLKAHLEDMNALRRETQRKIQTRDALILKSSQVPQLQNLEQDDALAATYPEEELVRLLNDPEFLLLRNDLVTFRMLEIRALNAVNKQKALRHEMQALVNRIANEQQVENLDALREDLSKNVLLYKSLDEQIKLKESELHRLRAAIESNPVYQKKPKFYNSLAASERIQDVLVQANSRASESNLAPVQPAGITFVNIDNQAVNQENFSLNPVSIPGMVYKIQIGAFNRPIDISSFSDFDPVTTDQVGNSIRYSAGLFYNKNQAFTSLNPIKALGYKDAFVVAYCDGVRYSVADSDELLRQGRCALNNAGEVAFQTTTKPEQQLDYNQGDNAAPAMTLEDAKGLLYAVQIGVYNTPRTHALLQNLEPLNTQLTERNQIRYSLGRFDDVQAAVRQRDEVRNLGFTDAFVVAYFNGERISIAEAQRIYQEQGDLALFNRQQTRKIEVADLKIEHATTDSLERLELLTSHELRYRLVSQNTFAKAPVKLIQQLRDANIWTYFDESKSRLVSATISSDFEIENSALELKAFYQGFPVQDTAEITFQNLEGYSDEESYYELTMSWGTEMPALVAHLLQENFTYSVSEWNAEIGELKFAPLNYVQKERIRKSLGAFGGVRFKENVITF